MIIEMKMQHVASLAATVLVFELPPFIAETKKFRQKMIDLQCRATFSVGFVRK